MPQTLNQHPVLDSNRSDLPPVTAIVSTHLRPQLMRRAVQSVVDQTYPGRIEIIVVFDDCPLEVPEIVVASNRTLRGTSNVRSGGPAGARNTGILAAGHELVAFLGDDDVWLPDKLAAQVGLFDVFPDAVLVGSAMQVDDGSRLRTRLVRRDRVDHADLIRDRYTGLQSSSFVLRRDALINTIGMVDEDLPGAYSEDYDLLLAAARIAPIRLIDRPLVTVSRPRQSLCLGRWTLFAQSLQYMLLKHPEFAAGPGYGHITSQLALALAASGQPRAAWWWVGTSLRRDPSQWRSYVAAAIALHLVPAETVMRFVAMRGNGI